MPLGWKNTPWLFGSVESQMVSWVGRNLDLKGEMGWKHGITWANPLHHLTARIKRTCGVCVCVFFRKGQVWLQRWPWHFAGVNYITSSGPLVFGEMLYWGRRWKTHFSKTLEQNDSNLIKPLSFDQTSALLDQISQNQDLNRCFLPFA